MKPMKVAWVVEATKPGMVYGEVYKHKWVALFVASVLLRKDDNVQVRREWIDP
jgi:hypothetical protein